MAPKSRGGRRPAPKPDRTPTLDEQNNPRPKSLKFKPKAAVRRTKEEREAQARAEEEKRREIASISLRSNHATFHGHGGWPSRGGRGGRGGNFRSGSSNRLVTTTSGPIGFVGHNASAAGARARDQGSAVIVKEELALTDGLGRGMGISDYEKARRSGKPEKNSTDSKLKPEGEYYSQDVPEEDYIPGRKVNVDMINLISDSEDEAKPEASVANVKGKSSAKLAAASRGLKLKPVRMERCEHIERGCGMSTNSSSLILDNDNKFSLGRLREDEKSVHDKAVEERAIDPHREWMGVWYEEEDITNIMIKEQDRKTIPVKPENPGKRRPSCSKLIETTAHHTSAKFDMQEFSSSKPKPLSEAIEAIMSSKAEPSPPSRSRKLKPIPQKTREKIIRRFLKPPYVLQTEYHRKEWENHLNDTRLLCRELGAIAPDDPEDTERINVENKLYMLQLPPRLPALKPVVVEESKRRKAKALRGMNADTSTVISSPASATLTPATNSKKVRAANPPAEPESPKFITATNPISVQGYIGKLRVHASGKVTLDWGGVKLGLKRSIERSFLQEVILLEKNRNTNESGSEPKDGKKKREDAWALSQVFANIMATPDWGDLGFDE